MGLKFQDIAAAEVQTKIEVSPNPVFRKVMAGFKSIVLDQDWVMLSPTHHPRGTSLTHKAILVDGDLRIDGKLQIRKKGLFDENILVVLGDLTVTSLKQAYGGMVFVAGSLTIEEKGDFAQSDAIFYQCGPVRANEVIGGGGFSWLTVYHPDIKIQRLRGRVQNETGEEARKGAVVLREDF